jgi:serine/threonine protein kinase/tetratricopeptide (TPR) repeat protein
MIKQRRLQTEAAEDLLLAELVEEYTRRLQAGERMRYSDFAREHPDQGEQLRQLLPALHVLANAGSSESARGEDQASKGGTTGATDALLGDYRLLREIGRGGMGVVYEAQQISLNRRVAVKVLPFASLLDPRQLQRFHNEAQAAACLHHEHIVPVFAVGCERGVHYYAMRFIDGQSLDQCLWGFQPPTPEEASPTCPSEEGASTERERLRATLPDTSVRIPVHGIIRLALQAAAALEHAHQQGIVHRDIKPANLLVNRDGDHLWITDFGLARCQGDTQLTRTGDLLGTLRYMSPEQALARPGLVDQRTDIYALGATIYELLTAQPVFPGQSRQELLQQIASQEPVPPRRLEPAVPLELETVVLKALAKNPSDRYTTAQELADDLQRFLDDRPIHARRPGALEKLVRWGRRHRSLVAVSLIGAGLLLISLAASTVIVGRQLVKERGLKEIARNSVDDMYLGFVQNWLAQKPELEIEQRELLLKALHAYQNFAHESGQDPRDLHGVAHAWHSVADIQARLGEQAEARKAYEQALAVLEGLERRLPRQPETQSAQAGCWNDLGNLERDSGRPGDAETAYRNARVLYARQANASPDDATAWAGLAGCSMNLGAILSARIRNQEAESLLHEAIEIERHWLANFPQSASWQHDLALALGCLADLKASLAHFDDAISLHRECLTYWTPLVKEYPDRFNYRQGLMRTQCSLAAVLAQTGELAAAENQYRSALAGAEFLAANHPRVPEFARALASTRNRLAHVRVARGEIAPAEAVLRQAVESLKAFVETHSGRPELQLELANCECDLGQVLAIKCEFPAAEQCHEQAARRVEALANARRAAPEQEWLRGQIAFRRANLMFDSGRRQEANGCYTRAIAIKAKLAESRADVAGYQADLAATLLDCQDVAHRDPRRAVELSARATGLQPYDDSAWFLLGSALYRVGRWQESLAALERARQLDRTNRPATWLYLALAYEKVGERSKANDALKQADAGLVGPLRKQRALGELREEVRQALADQNVSPADQAGSKARRQG